MKKRFLSVFLALALCLGLCTVPVLAAPSAEEAAKNFSVNYEVSGKTFEYIKNGIFGERSDRIVVDKDMTLVRWNGSTLTGRGYNAVTSDTTFTAKHAGSTDDGSYIMIFSTSFVNNGEGVYEQDWAMSQVLTQDGFRDTNVAQALGGIVTLKAGQSIQFKLPPVTTAGKYEEDVFYFLEIGLYYPGVDNVFTMGLLPFKLDNDAVNKYFAEHTPAPSFTDVSAGAFYADAVNWAVEQNITNGTGNNKFGPGKDCTHAEILTFLYRAARGEGTAAPEDMEKAISWAREKGMIGADFNSSAKCTRADAVNYIWQAFDKEDAPASSFNDVPSSADYAAAVNWAVANGITDGTGDGNFSPGKVCNRGTIVTLLHRAYVPSVRLK